MFKQNFIKTSRVNKLFIFAAIVENVETQLTGSGTTGPRYSPLEKDAVKMISMVTKTVSDCSLLEENVYSRVSW